MKITPSTYIYQCAGSPDVPEVEKSRDQVCATCAIEISSGIPINKIENPTFSQNADFLRFGAHVCQACAWLYWAGKGKPGNFIAAGDKYSHLVISHESVVEDKEPWHSLLHRISTYADDAIICGVLTTDVKPRLWPRTKLATIGNFGLYIHAPDYDISTFINFDLYKCLEISGLMKAPLISGYSKSSIYHGILSDYARSSKDIECAMRMESKLSTCRADPAFLPALLISGVTKEEKKDVRIKSVYREPATATKGGNQSGQTQLRLF